MEALSIVASLFTIWAQSSILAENKEFDRFKEEPVIEQQEQQIQKQEILEARLVVLTETRL